jgi:hypothetical protein
MNSDEEEFSKALTAWQNRQNRTPVPPSDLPDPFLQLLAQMCEESPSAAPSEPPSTKKKKAAAGQAQQKKERREKQGE